MVVTCCARLTNALTREIAHDAGYEAAYRPWPLPRAPWVMAQTWQDVVFLHWPVPHDMLRAQIPRRLSLDLYSGQAWLSITPLFVTGLRPRGVVAMPGLSAFPETNVRTYVTRDGKPGVWFFSLDAGSALAVATARRLYRLPYYRAEFSIDRAPERLSYRYRRRDRRASPVEFAAEYRSLGDPLGPATAGTLAWWLTERYCLYASGRRHLYRAEIHHRPWPLESAEVQISRNTLVDHLVPGLPGAAAVCQFARRLEVIVWAPERLPE